MNRNLQAVVEAFSAGLFAISTVLTALRTLTPWESVYTDPLAFDRTLAGRMSLEGGTSGANLLGIVSQPTTVILWVLMATVALAAILHVVGRLQVRFSPPLPRAVTLGLLLGAVWPWAIGTIPLFALILAALSCAALFHAIRTHPEPERGLGLYPLAFVTGWLTMSATSSLSLLLYHMGMGLERAILLGLLVAALAAAWVQLRLEHLVTFSLAAIWAMIGVAGETAGTSITIATACVLAIAAQAVVLVRVTT